MGVYLALLRGVNVGGNAKVPMAELKACFEQLGFKHARTFINSGNIIFQSDLGNEEKIVSKIEPALEAHFDLKISVLVINHAHYGRIVNEAPKDWGSREDFKYNALFLLPPYKEQEALESMGTLRSDVETVVIGEGVLYQSVSKTLFGRATTSKLAGMPIYKRMTVRNYNTTTKLWKLMNEE